MYEFLLYNDAEHVVVHSSPCQSEKCNGVGRKTNLCVFTDIQFSICSVNASSALLFAYANLVRAVIVPVVGASTNILRILFFTGSLISMSPQYSHFCSFAPRVWVLSFWMLLRRKKGCAKSHISECCLQQCWDPVINSVLLPQLFQQIRCKIREISLVGECLLSPSRRSFLFQELEFIPTYNSCENDRSHPFHKYYLLRWRDNEDGNARHSTDVDDNENTMTTPSPSNRLYSTILRVFGGSISTKFTYVKRDVYYVFANPFSAHVSHAVMDLKFFRWQRIHRNFSSADIYFFATNTATSSYVMFCLSLSKLFLYRSVSRAFIIHLLNVEDFLAAQHIRNMLAQAFKHSTPTRKGATVTHT